MITDSFTTTFFAVARGFHNLIFESLSAILFQLIVLGLGLTAIYSGLNLLWVMGALVSGSIFNFCYSFAIVKHKIKIKIIPSWDKKLIKAVASLTVPFGIFALFQRFYMHLDTVLLSILAGDKYVGFYQIAFKIVFALQFLPMAFIASLYPAMSNYWLNNRSQLSITFERAISYLMIISLPISAGVVALADKIILIFKTNYMSAVLPMQIIILSLLFIFINFPVGSLLNACDRQKQNTLNMVIAAILSVALNLILIPRFQALGASITVLVTNALMTFLGFYWARGAISYNLKKILKTFLKILICALAMGILVWYLKNYLNIFVLIILGAIIYFLLLFAIGGFKKEDIISIYHSFLPAFKSKN